MVKQTIKNTKICLLLGKYSFKRAITNKNVPCFYIFKGDKKKILLS